MSIRLDADIVLAEQDVEFHYLRSPGPGGQNVNKVASAVQLRFNAAACTALDDWSRARLGVLAGRRLTRDGWVVISAHRHRTQERNREDALARLAELVRTARERPKPRRATRPTRGAKERRLNAKKQRTESKRLRARPSLD